MNKQRVQDILVQVAGAGKTIPYAELSGQLGCNLTHPNDLWELLRVLNEISCQEYAEGRPLLSAVVVIPGIGYPERGFFLLARELCVNLSCDDRSFYAHELKRVHAYWKKHIPAHTPVEDPGRIRETHLGGASPLFPFPS